MIFNRPIWAPNVVIVDLPEGELYKTIPQILEHLELPNQIVAINALHDDLELQSRKIIIHQEDYEIYRELISESKNPSTLLLQNKAKIVYYVDADVEGTKAAFCHIYDLIGEEYPIICFSHRLPHIVQSGITIGVDITKYPKEKMRSTQFMTFEKFLDFSIVYNGETFIAE